jgi:hypothetical protein
VDRLPPSVRHAFRLAEHNGFSIAGIAFGVVLAIVLLLVT